MRERTLLRRRSTSPWKFVLLCFESIIFLAPIYWMLSTSFKRESDTIASPVQWIPARFTFENYISIFASTDDNIFRWALNSIFVSMIVTLVHVTLCSSTAFALARLRFKGRNAWFWIVLSSLMVPGFVTLIPTYIMMLQLNWIDSYNALIWPTVTGAFGVFMLRQFFSTLPRELEEAARLDGANSLQVFWYVIIPMSIPALVTLGIFAFLGSWNNYLWPLFVVHGDLQTLPVGLSNFSSRYVNEYGKLMAGTAVGAIPVIIIYLLAQSQFEKGITLTGSKE